MTPGTSTGNCGGDFDRNQFLGEAASGLRGQSLLMAQVGEVVLILARNSEAAGDTLGGEAHGEKRCGIVLCKPWVGTGFEAAKGKQAHGLDAAGNDDTVAAGADAQIGLHDGFKAGGAEAIDGDAGNLDRQTGTQRGKASDVPALLALRLGAAEDHVFDFGMVEAGNPLQCSVQGKRGKIVGASCGESALGGAAYRGANGADDDGFRHGEGLLNDSVSDDSHPSRKNKCAARVGHPFNTYSGISSTIQAFFK